MYDLRQLEEEQERKEEQTRYGMRARLLAAIMIPTWFPEYDPAIHQLDHKFSVACGWESHIPLEIISSKANLQLLNPKENMRKGKKCSISMEELFHGYQPHPFVTRVATMLRKMPVWNLKRGSVRVRRKLREFREARQLPGVTNQPLSPP